MLQNQCLHRMFRGLRAVRVVHSALDVATVRRLPNVSRNFSVYSSYHQNCSLNNNSNPFNSTSMFNQSRLFSTETSEEKMKSSPERETSKAAEENKQSETKQGESSSGEAPKEEKSEAQLAKEKIALLEAELSETRDHLLRALAETENVRARTAREVDHARTYAIQKFAKELLDVADNLHRATSCVSEEERKTANENNKTLIALYEGVEMTSKELAKVFQTNKIVEFGKVGDVFDPHMHEAMFQVNDPSKAANTIAQVLKTGYKFRDRVLRPAQVGTVAASSKQ